MPEIESEGDEQGSSMLKIHIVEQIEFYFGDFNMMKDKFLKQEVTKDNGWVSINTLLRFNRLASLSQDIEVILSAFKENPSNIVEVDFHRKCIRRNPLREIPEHDENWRNTVAQRSVYVKGFPVETTTLDDILKFMQTFGKIDNVFRRSYYDKTLKTWKFKGSVYIAFPTKEEAEKFISIKSVKYAGNELIRKWQLDYIEEKKAERIQQKLKAKETKDQLLEEQKKEIKKEMKKLPTGALIQLNGLNGKISVNKLKNFVISNFKWDVAFVEYEIGECTAFVRLQGENTAKEALEKLTNDSFEIENVTITAEIVIGERENELLEKMEADKNSRILQSLMKGKNKGKKNKIKKRGGKQDRNEEMKNNDAENINVDEKPSSSTAQNVKLESSTHEIEVDTSSVKRKPEENVSTTSCEGIKKPKIEPNN